MRKYFSWFVLALSLLVVSGCAANKAADENMAKTGAVDEAQARRGNGWMGNSSSTPDNSTKGSAADLLVGKKIMAMGKVNTDGTVSASRIMLGEVPNFAMGRPTSTPPASTGNGQYQRRAQTGGEEGQQFRGERPSGEAMTGQRQVRSAGSGGISAVSGEILKKDDTSLVLKMNDGGSKIVFYSDQTEILILTPPSASAEKQ